MNSLPYKIFFFLILTLSKGTMSTLAAYEAKPVFKHEGEVLWGFSFLDESQIFVTTRAGKLFLVNVASGKKEELKAPKVEAEGQGGLLHPEVIEVGKAKWLYLTFSAKRKGVLTTALARAPIKDGKAGVFEEIFAATVKSDTTRHFGSRLATDGKSLYMTVGDRGERQYAQDLNLHNGKILRLNFDGSPYSKNKSGGLKEIYSYGHRNPQGIHYDDQRKMLFSCEFGPRGGDELNLIKEGHNYGWPVITYGREYYGPKIGETHKEGMEQPLAYWVPSISPSGMSVYYGERYPKWKGDIFLANLSSTHLRRLKLSKELRVIEQEVLFDKLEERIRHVEVGPDGHLYFSTDSGQIFKIIEKS